MIIIKRNGQAEPYDIQKIKNAVLLAFKSVGQVYKEEEIEKVTELVEYKIKKILSPSVQPAAGGTDPGHRGALSHRAQLL